MSELFDLDEVSLQCFTNKHVYKKYNFVCLSLPETAFLLKVVLACEAHCLCYLKYSIYS